MGGIGNTLMATPLIAAVRKLYPQARIDLLTTPSAAALLTKSTDITNILADQDGDDHSLIGYWRLQRRIRSVRYDVALLTLNAVTFRFAIRSVLARIPTRVIHAYPFHSYDDYTPAFSNAVQRNSEIHDVECNLDLIRAISGSEIEAGALSLTLTSDGSANAAQRLADRGWDAEKKTVALCPGSSGWMSFKRWPLDSFIQLAKAIAADQEAVNLIVFSGPDEKDEVSKWKQELSGSGFILVEGLSLPVYAGALTHCDVVVTNDSLPMHMCAALQVPTVALFGPTDAKRTGPWKCPTTILEAQTEFTPFVTIPYPPDPAQFPESMPTITVTDVHEAVRGYID